MQSIYESNVDPLRPNDAHGISLQLVGKSKSVLELGAASGHVTKALKSLGNTVTAVERDGRFQEVLTQIADSVIITNLDWLDLRSQLAGQKFDVILAGDVLEHCMRPELVLLQLHDLLNTDGYVVISLPNVAHGDVRLSLLTGKFPYRDTGLLDRTHLRFFTRESINELLVQNHFEVAEIFGVSANIGETEFGTPSPQIPTEAIRYVQSDTDSLIYQYIVRAKPITQDFKHFKLDHSESFNQLRLDELLAQICLLEEQVARNSIASSIVVKNETELAQSKTELAQLKTELAQLKTDLSDIEYKLKTTQLDLLGARDFSIGTIAELGETRYLLNESQKQIDSLVHQLHLLHQSRTWRIGRFMLLPLRAVRKLLRIILS